MREDRVVQQHQGALVGHSDFELRSKYRHARLRNRVDMVDSRYSRHDLLSRRGDQALDVACRCTGKRHEHIRHRDVDLRLFLAWCHQHGEHTEQEQDQRDQRRKLTALEEAGDAPGDAHGLEGMRERVFTPSPP
jgi:hypothetical protein